MREFLPVRFNDKEYPIEVFPSVSAKDERSAWEKFLEGYLINDSPEELIAEFGDSGFYSFDADYLKYYFDPGQEALLDRDPKEIAPAIACGRKVYRKILKRAKAKLERPCDGGRIRMMTIEDVKDLLQRQAKLTREETMKECMEANNKRKFTGLYDKNGEEIKEGDIVKCVDMHDSNVFDNAWKIQDNGLFRPIPQIIRKDKDGIDWSWPSDIRDHPTYWEVVGNIYENPELLNTEAEGGAFKKDL